MSKSQKSRKYRRPNLPKTGVPVDRAGGESAPVAVAMSANPRASASRAEAFNPDYTHVKRDLRRIGILAGSFIGIMIVLSFFI